MSAARIKGPKILGRLGETLRAAKKKRLSKKNKTEPRTVNEEQGGDGGLSGDEHVPEEVDVVETFVLALILACALMEIDCEYVGDTEVE